MKILISTGDTPQNYRNALEACGAEVTGGYLPELTADCDGLVLCGGSDIDPGIYGEELNGSFGIDWQRDEREMELLRLYAGKPILGICRGHQIVNAWFGGKLDQDIAVRSAHTGENYKELFHGVEAAEGSRMEQLFGHRFRVNSSHHQAISAVAPGFRATLWSPDGVIEAIEHETLPILGVQWHPERTTLSFRSDCAVDGMPLFRYFLSLCK